MLAQTAVIPNPMNYSSALAVQLQPASMHAALDPILASLGTKHNISRQNASKNVNVTELIACPRMGLPPCHVNSKPCLASSI